MPTVESTSVPTFERTQHLRGHNICGQALLESTHIHQRIYQQPHRNNQKITKHEKKAQYIACTWDTTRRLLLPTPIAGWMDGRLDESSSIQHVCCSSSWSRAFPVLVSTLITTPKKSENHQSHKKATAHACTPDTICGSLLHTQAGSWMEG